ncbi:MAG: agmatine deiminase family protein [Candidatus Nomurabacteria bacterium]|nr:agmatine deiminase family protein [Candidatus Nomurabacteria bacterium]
MLTIPKELGYYMPAEWEKHSAVWLAWPYGDITFPNILNEIEQSYCQIIKAIEDSEKVKLIVLNESEKERISKMFISYGIKLDNIIFYIVPSYVDVWIRDYAPITLFNKENSKLAFVKWNYNAYGRGDDPFFADLLKDDKVFSNILDESKYKIFKPDIVLEGGAIELNGRGTLLTTEQCLLNKNRNSELDRSRTEIYLKAYLGVENIIWLKEGLVNDHTDGHIDEIARFVNPNTIVCAYEKNKKDPNYVILNDNYKTLKKARTENGKKFKIIKLPMPHMDYDNGEKAPVSYTNFYIGNSVILMSIFNDLNDKKAMKIIKSLFKKHKVIGIDCSKIIYGGGAIHCITMQEYL